MRERIENVRQTVSLLAVNPISVIQWIAEELVATPEYIISLSKPMTENTSHATCPLSVLMRTSNQFVIDLSKM
jgi:hypothetical protein